MVAPNVQSWYLRLLVVWVTCACSSVSALHWRLPCPSRAVLPGELPVSLPQRDVQPCGAQTYRHRQLQGRSWTVGHPQASQVRPLPPRSASSSQPFSKQSSSFSLQSQSESASAAGVLAAFLATRWHCSLRVTLQAQGRWREKQMLIQIFGKNCLKLELRSARLLFPSHKYGIKVNSDSPIFGTTFL